MLRTKAFNCRPFAISHKDANIIIRKTGQTGADLADASTPEFEDTALAAAQIVRILWMKNGGRPSRSNIPAVLLIVRRHKELDATMTQQDPYRGLGFAVAGCLFLAGYEDFEIIPVDSVVCPFARTEYNASQSQLPKVPNNLVHVLPVVRVRHSSLAMYLSILMICQDLHWIPSADADNLEDEDDGVQHL